MPVLPRVLFKSILEPNVSTILSLSNYDLRFLQVSVDISLWFLFVCIRGTREISSNWKTYICFVISAGLRRDLYT